MIGFIDETFTVLGARIHIRYEPSDYVELKDLIKVCLKEGYANIAAELLAQARAVSKDRDADLLGLYADMTGVYAQTLRTRQ